MGASSLHYTVSDSEEGLMTRYLALASLLPLRAFRHSRLPTHAEDAASAVTVACSVPATTMLRLWWWHREPPSLRREAPRW